MPSVEGTASNNERITAEARCRGMLDKVDLKDNYSSDDSSILEDVFKPCLKSSVTYFRSVGYLDSKVLGLLAEEFSEFAHRGGRAKLLIGQTVSAEDYLAIKRGATNPEDYVCFPDIFSLWEAEEENSNRAQGLLALSWLVAHGVVEVRFSLRPRGIHHDKFALFRDERQNEVVLHGTNNETEAASLPEFNYESLSVFKSWDTELFRRHGEYKIEQFLRLWDGVSKHSVSVAAPHPILEKIVALQKAHADNPRYRELFEELRGGAEKRSWLPEIPAFAFNRRYALFEHQKKAINAFFDNDYRGIFALATGSGKTITAIHATTTLSLALATENSADILIIVAVPYQVLADQWVDNLGIFGYSPIRAYGSKEAWIQPLQHAVNLMSFDPAARVVSVVAVNKTLASKEFLDLVGTFPASQTIIIGDECHRLGSPIQQGRMPDADFRLGLSATPWAASETQLRDALTSYFGPTIAHYGLSDAFADEVLVPYEYYFRPVTLSSDENEVYAEHTAEAKRLQAIRLSGGDIDENKLNFHLNMRAAVLGSTDEKFQLLPDVLSDVRTKIGLRKLLVYCGSGSTDDSDHGGEAVRDIARAQRVASDTVGLQSARVTAAETPAIRKALLGAFQADALQAIFAIKVLDEGFDMPGIRGAILMASSRNERQFIQRRGRVLRKAPGKESAIVWDFLVMDDGSLDSGYAKELLEAELIRILEFARFATNFEDLAPEIRRLAALREIDYDALLSKLEEQGYEVTDVQ